MESAKSELSQKIIDLAAKLGFTACGFAPAMELKADGKRLRKWLDQGMHAGMSYMENHFDKRINPSLLEKGTKTVIVVLLNYLPEQQQDEADNFLISKYAWGRDYHKLMKNMLNHFLKEIKKEIIPVNGRAFVDSAPVLERSLAALAGLGWIGKNANLISQKEGSFFFVGELLVDIELEYGKQLPDYCGSCSMCIDACPTKAIIEPGLIDSRRCISYWTIEHKGAIDESLKGKFKNRIFGCDICQDVCPWNRKAKSADVKDFQSSPDLLAMTRKDWEELTEDKFNELFQGSAVKRTKYGGLMRNIRFIEE